MAPGEPPNSLIQGVTRTASGAFLEVLPLIAWTAQKVMSPSRDFDRHCKIQAKARPQQRVQIKVTPGGMQTVAKPCKRVETLKYGWHFHKDLLNDNLWIGQSSRWFFALKHCVIKTFRTLAHPIYQAWLDWLPGSFFRRNSSESVQEIRSAMLWQGVQAPSFKIYKMTCRVLRHPETPNEDPKTLVLFQRPVNYMQFRDHSQECSSRLCRSSFSGLRHRSLHLPKRLAATDLWEETQEAHIQHAGHFTIGWKCRCCDATKEP